MSVVPLCGQPDDGKADFRQIIEGTSRFTLGSCCINASKLAGNSLDCGLSTAESRSPIAWQTARL
jgi:hypothetical protein